MCLSQPWSRNTFFAKSIPTIVICIFGPSLVLYSIVQATIVALEAVIERGAVHPIKSISLHQPGRVFAPLSRDPLQTSVLSQKFVYKIGQPIRGFGPQF